MVAGAEEMLRFFLYGVLDGILGEVVRYVASAADWGEVVRGWL